MANPNFYTRIQLKYDTLDQWNKCSSDSKPWKPLKGEVCLVQVKTTGPSSGLQDTPPSVLMKVGDGETAFHKLPWLSALAADVHSWAKLDADKFTKWIKGEAVEGMAACPIKFATAQDIADLSELINTARTEEIAWTRIPEIPDDKLPNKGSATTYGTTSNDTLKHGESFSVPYVTTDAKGRVTGGGVKTVTLPDVGDISTEIGDIGGIAKSAFQDASIDGTTLTFTRTEGAADTVILPTANGTTLGFVKQDQSGDVTINNGIITVNDNSHNHTMANITGLADKFTSVEKSITDSDAVAKAAFKDASINGTTLTFTRTEGTADTVTLPTANGTTTLGLVKQGGDVTIANGVITVTSGASHTHTTSQITGLDTTLQTLANKDTDFEGRIATMETFWKAAQADGTDSNVIDTLKEIQEYIAGDQTGAAAMAASIQQNADDIEAINKEIGSSKDEATANTVYGAIKAVATDLQSANDEIAKSFNDVSLGEDGVTITFTKQDSTKKSIKIQDTTYNAAGTELGLVKTGGDVTIENGIITVNDDSHNHVIDNVDGLQQALNDINGLINTARTEEIAWTRIPTVPETKLPTKGTAGSYGLESNATPKHGEAFNVPYFTTDAYGRVTAASTQTVTLPDVSAIEQGIEDLDDRFDNLTLDKVGVNEKANYVIFNCGSATELI